MHRRRILLAAAATVGLAGCNENGGSAGTPSVTATDTPTATPTPTHTETETPTPDPREEELAAIAGTLADIHQQYASNGALGTTHVTAEHPTSDYRETLRETRDRLDELGDQQLADDQQTRVEQARAAVWTFWYLPAVHDGFRGADDHLESAWSHLVDGNYSDVETQIQNVEDALGDVEASLDDLHERSSADGMAMVDGADADGYSEQVDRFDTGLEQYRAATDAITTLSNALQTFEDAGSSDDYSEAQQDFEDVAEQVAERDWIESLGETITDVDCVASAMADGSDHLTQAAKAVEDGSISDAAAHRDDAVDAMAECPTVEEELAATEPFFDRG